MAKRFFTTILLLGLILSLSSTAFAAPSGLIANSLSENQIELNWTGADVSGYDIWMSKNGFEWQKVNSQSVTEDTYVVEEIVPFTNYYFLVTNFDAVPTDNPDDPNPNPMDYTNSVDYNGTGQPNSSDIAMVFSPRESVHGNYKKNTNACSKCHRTHDAASPSLLITKTVNDTCITCHDGTQSKYDVLKGEIETNNSGDFLTSAAGPFGNLGIFSNYFVDKNGDNVQDIIPDTMSAHSISDDVYVGQALKTPRNDGEWGKPFGCGSCHQVHAQEYDPETDSYNYIGGNYRMLAKNLPGQSNVGVLAFAETSTGRENIYYRQGINKFCLGCHTDYYESVSGETYGYVTMGSLEPHKIGVSSSVYEVIPDEQNFKLPLEGSVTDEVYYSDNKIMCLTCHASHGSNTIDDIGGPNFLLRKDGRNGVCVRCHTQLGN